MEINEVKIGDQVTFTHKKKKITGKVIYRHEGKDKAALMGHVNVNIEDGGSYPVTVHVSKLKPALKEETSMNEEKIEHTLDLIDFIASENHVEAEKQFDAILQDKIDIILDAAKQEVAENIFNTQECAECTEEVEQTNEALKGAQHKIDMNKNGKLDAHDFKLLRGRKTLKLLGRKTPKSERMDRNLAKRVENNKSMKVEQNVFTGHKSIKHANLETPETQKRRDDDVKKRQAGRVAVIKKLNAKGAKIGEEVKQVDEISQKTKDSYVAKRGSQLSSMMHGSSKNYNLLSGKKQAKAVKGIKQALNKEEVEPVVEYQRGLWRPQEAGMKKSGTEKGKGVVTTYHYQKKSSNTPTGAKIRMSGVDVHLGTSKKSTRRKKST